MLVDFSSDLHLDNAMLGGPLGWVGDVLDFGKVKNAAARGLLIGGDTSQQVDDTADVLNCAKNHYEFVVAVLGNHESGSLTRWLHPGVTILDLLPGNAVSIDDVLIVGGCMATESEQLHRVKDAVVAGWRDGMNVVVLSHFVPLNNLEEIGHKNVRMKCNGFIDLLGEAEKPTTIVFGHYHTPINQNFRGFTLRSNPRGYRGERQKWPGMEQLEII